MDFLTLVLGIAAAIYGVYTAYARMKTPEKFGKLEAMKGFWGEKPGIVIHFVAYTIVPIVVGITFIVMAFNGKSIFGG